MMYELGDYPGQYSRVDPRQLAQFMRIPGFAQSLSSVQHSGIRGRIDNAKWTAQERIVYDVVSEGVTPLDTLPVTTGLSQAEIDSALVSLVGKGALRFVEDEKTSG